MTRRQQQQGRRSPTPDDSIGERLARISAEFFAKYPQLRPTPGGRMTDVDGRDWIDGRPR